MTQDKAQAPWITWYGDDFTGSAAVMEVLTFAGLPSVLFTEIPSEALLQRFAGSVGIGLASTARSQPPDQMRESLPDGLSFLHGLDAPLLHYKLCSTFDSAPDVGSIGLAIEIALGIRPAKAVPILTAAPQMRRYQAFGHLFAGTPDGVFRLDRHPVMSRHPVTPMAEGDLARHLAEQTDLPTALVDLEALWSDPEPRLEAALRHGARLIFLDSMEAQSEAAAGALIWQNRARMGLAAGSQGVEYALVRHWQETGLIEAADPPGSVGAVDRIAAVSGSMSPITARQLEWAAVHGFRLLQFDATATCRGPRAQEAEAVRVADLAVEAASEGLSPLVHTGEDDGSLAAAREDAGFGKDEVNRRIGEALGRILSGILDRTGMGRAVVSGGDTSGHVMGQLGLSALTAIAPTIPGAALCRGHGDGPRDGLEIALKGGQMGSEDFFGWIRDGGGARA